MSNKANKVECGDLVRDNVTGFEGIATGVHLWITGCTSVTVQPREMQEGKVLDGKAFDSPRLTILQKAACVIESTAPDSPARTGGPKEHPSNEKTVG